MATTSLQKRSSAGALALRVLRHKFHAALFLPKLALAFLKFDSSGELVADTDLTLGGNFIGSVDTRSGAGAISVTAMTTLLTTTGGAQALTLANGTAGQIKTIIHDVDGGSGVLTPATKTGFTTITFTNVGESATLQYVATRGWMILALNGAVAA